MRPLRVIVALVVMAASLWALPAGAASIPQDALRYRSELVRASRYYWGLNAPVATFAAQIHAESRWRSNAVSPVGARGIAQFMPATADWISGIYAHLRANEPENPAWGIRALVTYDAHLWKQIRASDDFQRMAKTLAAYNGGLGWVFRDEKLAASKGLNPLVWFGSVETCNAGRHAAAKRENTQYPRKILLEYQPLYEGAGWGRGVHDE